MNEKSRVYLSPPQLGDLEWKYVQEAFDTNWIAPLGPNVDQFELEFAAKVGSPNAVALSSGTAALHLAIRLSGVVPGDEVVVSSLTFCASVNPIVYEGAKPVFVDSESGSWNIDPNLVEELFQKRSISNRLPKALVVVHLYGQSADLDPLLGLCERYGVALIEDAAESLGATYRGKSTGTFGKTGIFSFNGNKIITTSGGGMLVTEDESVATHARKLATQAREPAPHYEHKEIGFNYRMSNVLAGIGRGQLRMLDAKVDARRKLFDRYYSSLSQLPGLAFMPEAEWGKSNRWLTCLTVDPDQFGCDRESVRAALQENNIESRPVWKPMHLQPVFSHFENWGGTVSENLFKFGLCLPSGSNLQPEEQSRVIDIVKNSYKG